MRGIGTWGLRAVSGGVTARAMRALSKVLAWVDGLRPNRTVLTHMGPGLDYTDLRRVLPRGIVPAYDGVLLEELEMLSE